MMTQTHTLIAASLLASPQRTARQNTAILLGSLVPDTAIYVLFVWSKIAGIPERQLWREIYFSEPMLTFTAIGNSLPLYMIILFIGLFIAYRQFGGHEYSPNGQLSIVRRFWVLATVSALGLFALAAITHLLGDFGVHVTDAHPHFWPFSDWRFESSISYWDRRHHGDLFSFVEAAIGVALSVVLFRRFKAKWVRGLTLLALLAYIAVPVYFILKLGS